MKDHFDLPTADMFCREKLSDGAKRCAYGWAIENGLATNLDYVSGYSDRPFDKVFIAEAVKLDLFGSLSGYVSRVNDSKDNTLVQIALCYENTVKAMGYTITEVDA